MRLRMGGESSVLRQSRATAGADWVATSRARWRRAGRGGGELGGVAFVAAANAGAVQGEAAALAVGTAAARDRATAASAGEASVGLLPRSSLSSHLRWSSFLSFFK